MISDQDFLLLASQDRKELIALMVAFNSEVKDRRKGITPLELPMLPSIGQYVIRDSTDTVRAVLSETEVWLNEVEGMAVFFSSIGKCKASLYFYFNDCSELLSEWRNGRKVEKSIGNKGYDKAIAAARAAHPDFDQLEPSWGL